MNGSLSAAKGRRSVSAEMTLATMRAELVATPITAEASPLGIADKVAEEEEGDDSASDSLSSSFSTPTGVHAAGTGPRR